MKGWIPYEDHSQELKHDTGFGSGEQGNGPHVLTRVARLGWPCADQTLYVECSCGSTFTTVVSEGGCGQDHAIPDLPRLDPFHNSLFLLDSSPGLTVNEEMVLRDQSIWS